MENILSLQRSNLKLLVTYGPCTACECNLVYVLFCLFNWCSCWYLDVTQFWISDFSQERKIWQQAPCIPTYISHQLQLNRCLEPVQKIVAFQSVDGCRFCRSGLLTQLLDSTLLHFHFSGSSVDFFPCTCSWLILHALKIAFLEAHDYNSTMARGAWLTSSLVPLPELGLIGVLFGFQRSRVLSNLGPSDWAIVYGPCVMLISTNQATIPLICSSGPNLERGMEMELGF